MPYAWIRLEKQLAWQAIGDEPKRKEFVRGETTAEAANEDSLSPEMR
jgi:hypothetical protein